MQSIDKQIEIKIKQNRRGKIFFGEDFAKFGFFFVVISEKNYTFAI